MTDIGLLFFILLPLACITMICGLVRKNDQLVLAAGGMTIMVQVIMLAVAYEWVTPRLL